MITDKYLMEALDAYPNDLAQTVESLNYALSYDEENIQALCLMGRLYAEQMGQYERAIEYFENALANNVQEAAVYPFFIDALILNEDFKKAENAITFALKMKGIDKAVIWLLKSLNHEHQFEFKKAKRSLKMAKRYVFNKWSLRYIDDSIERLNQKMGKTNKKKRKKKKK